MGDDAAHSTKLTAFLRQFLSGTETNLSQSVASLHLAWNGLGNAQFAAKLALPEPKAWAAQCQKWRTQLQAPDDLCTQLMRFSSEQR